MLTRKKCGFEDDSIYISFAKPGQGIIRMNAVFLTRFIKMNHGWPNYWRGVVGSFESVDHLV
jgi:hypothetical protein